MPPKQRAQRGRLGRVVERVYIEFLSKTDLSFHSSLPILEAVKALIESLQLPIPMLHFLPKPLAPS